MTLLEIIKNVEKKYYSSKITTIEENKKYYKIFLRNKDEEELFGGICGVKINKTDGSEVNFLGSLDVIIPFVDDGGEYREVKQ